MSAWSSDSGIAKDDPITMIQSLKKFLLWQLRFLSSLYGPVILTIILALLQGYFFLIALSGL
ncbi:hypothetical protein Q5A_013060 [Serratia inhibens PRI-2C]|nr:hypothetical protein Q5A_013060 [Serratia inhibens PRI-2C]